MRKNMIAGIALASGMLLVGTLTASAAGSCCIDGKCSDKQTVRQFTKETSALTSALKAKGIELRELAAYGTYDIRRQEALEEEIKEIKTRINVVGQKHDIPACCRS